MHKKILLILAVFALVAAGAQAQDKKNGKDIFGYFYFKGRVSNDFTDIREIHLAGDFGAREKPPFYGLIRLKSRNAKDFAVLKPTGIGKNISFATKTVGGVSYQFTGAFTRVDIEERETKPEEVVLKGTLTKLKNGAKVAAEAVSFTYFPGT